MRKLSLVLTVVVLLGCQKQQQPVTSVYDTAPVQVRNIEVTVEAAGVIEAESLVEVKSKASGEVLAVHAETGDVVKAGSLLVEIDKRTPTNLLSQTQANLVAAEARRNIAKTQMERAEKLFKTQTLTQSDYEKTQLDLADAQAQVVSAQVAVENARITLQDTDVRAPITGTIITKTVEPGIVISSPTQAVSGGTVLMQMADLTNVQVRTRVDETDIGKIQAGMPAKVTVAAYPNQPFNGEVLKVEPQAIVEQNVTMFSVLIRLPNPNGLLKPGMNADVEIEIAHREDVPAVPTAALRVPDDVPASAKMLGMDEAVLRREIAASAGKPEAAEAKGAGGKHTLKLGSREIELPADVDAAKVGELFAKRRSGQELTEDERALLRRVMQQAGGFRGGGSNGGGGFPGGGGPPGGFASSGPEAGRTSQGGVSKYQFSGEYWVVALRNNQPVPVAVRTGLTDLEYSELMSGLKPGDRVLLLPSASLYDQQERLQQFISQRFGSSTPFQQQGPRGGVPRGFR
jgi:HlyD family secretion protein